MASLLSVLGVCLIFLVVRLVPRPKWNFDGSSTGQAPGEDSEVIIYPQAVYPDPFRGGDNIMVLCDCYKPDGTPIDGNTRKECAEIMEGVSAACCFSLVGRCTLLAINVLLLYCCMYMYTCIRVFVRVC